MLRRERSMAKCSPLKRHLTPLLVLILLSSPTTSRSAAVNRPPAEPATNKHFVLVHGASHGAWSWYKVSTILKSWGHNVTALDMAGCGIDPRQAKTLSSISDYFQPLTEFMEALPSGERVVLAGHSLGGVGIAKAMEDLPEKISVAVFVTATMPGPNLSVSTIWMENEKHPGPPLDSHFIYEDGPDKPPTALVSGPLKLAAYFYQLSPPQDLTLATTLVRPHGPVGKKGSGEELVFTSQRYGSVKRAFVISEKDLLATKKFQMWMIENNPPDFVAEIRGSDHMVIMSKPLELARQLEHIVYRSRLIDI